MFKNPSSAHVNGDADKEKENAKVSDLGGRLAVGPVRPG